MELINSLLNLINKKEKISKEDVPEGFCPNCWGRQEYGGQFYEAVKNYGVDINNTDPKVGWIQEYADKHLLGIQLKKKDDMLVCQNCNLTYRPVE